MLLAAASALAVAALPACAAPTEIVISVRTDVACPFTKGTSVTAGAPSSAESSAPSTIDQRCMPDGEIGTLVIVPASDDDATITIRVVLGVDADVSTCTAENDYEGCIVQRRRLSFIENTTLELPFDMLLVCRGVPCDDQSTCAANGRCVPLTISDPMRCVPPMRCFPDDDPANDTGGLPTDGTGEQKRPPPADASDGGNGGDATIASDASHDASTDARFDASFDGSDGSTTDGSTDGATDARDASDASDGAKDASDASPPDAPTGG